MHKRVILLVKADNTAEAKEKANEFMSGCGGDENNLGVWDWYVIGGRWSGTLNSIKELFYDKVKDLEGFEGEYYSYQAIENNKEKLQSIWEELGGKGLNIFARDNYTLNGYDDDIMPLKDCIDVVKDFLGDITNRKKEAWEQLITCKEDMRGLYAKEYSNIHYDNFSFESNVYDTERYSNSIPENIEGYYAIVIDMHN